MNLSGGSTVILQITVTKLNADYTSLTTLSAQQQSTVDCTTDIPAGSNLAVFFSPPSVNFIIIFNHNCFLLRLC